LEEIFSVAMLLNRQQLSATRI